MKPERISPLSRKTGTAPPREDLERYRRLALSEGAGDAVVIPAGSIPIDERVRFKCRIPQCSMYGLSYNCPPHSPPPDETRALVKRYEHGILFRTDVPAEVTVWVDETARQRNRAYRRVTEIVNAVESAAFYDGYYLSVGFGAGTCKKAFCSDQECRALKGEECRFSLRARPSMESVGMDAFRMAVDAGWDVYPVGSDAESTSFPMGLMMGLVLVG